MGVTENMSRGDLLVSLHKEQLGGVRPAVGDPWLVEIDLPSNHSFGRKCMQCQTTVARLSEGASGTLHVALRIHKIRFQPAGDAVAVTPVAETERVVM